MDQANRPTPEREEAAREFEQHRPRLFSLAYRMLGSAAEAEDAVQDAYLRWHGAETGQVAAPGPWLNKVLTNLCLTRLTSARARREEYPGTWLPEPVAGAALGPLERAEQREAVSFAVLTMMERLSPPERAAVVLHDAFGYSHREVAGVLDRTEAAARQLYHRGRTRLAAEAPPTGPADAEQAAALLARFLRAAADGDLEQLEELLAAQVVVWTDGGGRARAALRPVHGRTSAARFLAGLFERFTDGVRLELAEANGGPVLLGWEGDALTSVGLLEAGPDGVTAVRILRNPDKLAHYAHRHRPLSQNR
ncbi:MULTISPECIES: RNA polymerase sigma factor SigJ [Kitasatospora]|uniref:Putative RNA polymerase ECF subfamily sigma factor n=1 Tax=Kitasatospora setae (strain ATCC 33774 / DSM 43861 / JCM 3304 / KCC A-0304 / NBRC 14216 / KM-6054) TaxID=452652 RepID=E4NDS9_KITSK|nr:MULTISPECIES: RNA polymerase sigma factor SigJ [Kitasatospora]BAJ29360.1 putative RNA polymerase ECF subfamily sigma factor [Kitasatospora setae KM-6054]